VAAGSSAYVDVVAGNAELLGAPARAESVRGNLEAPRIVHSTKTGLVQAFDGVKARFEEGAVSTLAGGGLGGGGTGPVRVASHEAFLQQSERVFGFRGDVRAWRGDQLLLADQMRGDEGAGTLAANGHVRTVWRPAAPDAADPGAAPPQAVEVDAGSLLYRQTAGEAIYDGGVVARQAGRTLRCQKGRIELDADQRMRRFLASGDVRLEEPAERRTLTGVEATYDLTAETIVVDGSPAVLTDPVRGRAEGRQVVYDLRSGRLRLLATPPEPAA
jgi:lipopolysaccharide export system protein LptA